MHEYAPEVLIVLLDPVVQVFYLGLGQKPENMLLKLPGAFAGNYLDQGNFLRYRFGDNSIEFAFDRSAAIINIV